jgi:hypothetical protein
MNPPAAPLERRLPPADQPVDPDGLLDAFLDYVDELGLTLYRAQEEAIVELFAGNNVILSTPTGSGKTLVAVAACFKGLAEGQSVFYTAPIKALVSEKFFGLCDAFGARYVGMMTGDASINRAAPIICCTAEILSNYALSMGANADVAWAILDEFHYYADRDRGVAWQVPLLTLPQSRFVLMSATLGEASGFRRALTELTGVPTALVKSTERPVPLDWEYRETPLHETISALLRADQAPVYIVHFSQQAACEAAQDLMSIDFLTREQKLTLRSELKRIRFDSPFGKELQRWLPHGVGVHHAGMLPKYRLLVEKLAQRGLLKLICGTDTLGVGVNIPIRTVLLTKLCKYDGAHTRVLSVREFQQIAGRAGRKGFDERGSVVGQAPEHVIANRTQREKAAGDPKKLRKLRPRKPPERGYAHWDRQTFDRLRTAEPETLASRFAVSHGLLLQVLGRQDQDGCRAVRELIQRCHEPPARRRRHERTAWAMFRSLLDANIVELKNGRVAVNADLQSDFSLNHALSVYAVEAIHALDPLDEDYALVVLSILEAILETPWIVIRRQVDVLKRQLLAELKAQGVEYEERIAELEKVEHPMPEAEFIRSTFSVFARHHPWVGADDVMPKSIARELYETGACFRDYVKEYGLQHYEGVLLRYLTNAYRALVQNVPERAKTTEVCDLTDWLGAEVRAVDASLIEEWERLRDPARAATPPPKPELPEAPEDITANPHAFLVQIRNAVWRIVQALARRDYARAATLLGNEDEDGNWSAAALAEVFAEYWQEYGILRTDPAARNPRYLEVHKQPTRWEVRQILVDPEGHLAWALQLRVDLPASQAAGEPVLDLLEVQR